MNRLVNDKIEKAEEYFQKEIITKCFKEFGVVPDLKIIHFPAFIRTILSFNQTERSKLIEFYDILNCDYNIINTTLEELYKMVQPLPIQWSNRSNPKRFILFLPLEDEFYCNLGFSTYTPSFESIGNAIEHAEEIMEDRDAYTEQISIYDTYTDRYSNLNISDLKEGRYNLSDRQ